MARKLCTHNNGKDFRRKVKNKVANIVIKEKMNDAYAEYRSKKHKDTKIWKECKKMLTGALRNRYATEWRIFVRDTKRKLSSDARKKIDWLVSKWRKIEDVQEI